MEKTENGLFMDETEIFQMLDVLLDMLERMFTAEGLRGLEALAEEKRIAESVRALNQMREEGAK